MTERINQKKTFQESWAIRKLMGFLAVAVECQCYSVLSRVSISSLKSNKVLIIQKLSCPSYSEQHLQKSNRTNSHLKDSIMEH